MTSRRTPRAPRRLLTGFAGAVLLVVAAGCAADSDAPQDIFQPEGANAQKIADLNFVYVLAAVVALLVFAVVGFVMWKFRERKDGDEPVPDAAPRQHPAGDHVDDRPGGAPGGRGRADRGHDLRPRREPAPTPCEITVVGQQWWWEFDYPDLKDADGLPIVTSGEMVIPAGKPRPAVASPAATSSTRSGSPALNGKRDAVPGPRPAAAHAGRRAGRVLGPVHRVLRPVARQHAHARRRAVAEADWETWVANQLQDAAEPTDEVALRRQDDRSPAQCARCHQVNGIDRRRRQAAPDRRTPPPRSSPARCPNLTHLMSRTTFAGAHRST